MDTLNITNTAPYILDVAPIFISGMAILYCTVLSRKLKNANNLKTGVGASILTLSQAIESTHQAAQEAQTSTVQTIETLRHLLAKSESVAPKVEVLISELEQASNNARVHQRQLDNVVDMALAPAIDKAQTTASGLLKIVSDIDRYKETLPKIEGQSQDTKEQDTKENELVKLTPAQRTMP